jgi:hypothetical protein
MAKDNKQAKTTSTRSTYAKVSVKLSAAEKKTWKAVKEKLSKEARYTLKDDQVSEYIVRTFLADWSRSNN